MQKGRYKIFICGCLAALCTVYLLANPLIAVSANDTNQVKAKPLISSSKLIKNLTQLCSENTPDPLEFPDGFGVSNVSVACETA